MLLETLLQKDLRPLELFKLTLRFFKDNFKLLTFAGMLVYLPINILLSTLTTFAFRLLDGVDVAAMQASDEAILAFLNSDAYIQIRRYLGWMNMIQIFLVPLCVLTIAYVVKRRVVGAEVFPQEAVFRAFLRYPSVCFSAIVSLFLTSVGLALFILPGLYLRVAFMFFMYDGIISDLGPISALTHSVKLVNKRFFRMLLLNVLCFVGGAGLGSAVSWAVSFLGAGFAGDLIARTIVVYADIFVYCLLSMVYLRCHYSDAGQRMFGPMAA